MKFIILPFKHRTIIYAFTTYLRFTNSSPFDVAFSLSLQYISILNSFKIIGSRSLSGSNLSIVDIRYNYLFITLYTIYKLS